MKPQTPPTPLNLHILRLTAHGEGVARSPDGRLVFVDGALPDEHILATLTEEHPRFLRARLTSLPDAEHTSPLRRPLDCPHDTTPDHPGCGGCGLRHLRDDASLSLKAEATHAELQKLARAVVWPAFALHPSPQLDHYRHRLSLHTDPSDPSKRIGFYRAGSHEVIHTPACLAACDDLRRAWPTFSALAAGTTKPPHKWVVEAHHCHLWSAWKGISTKSQHATADALTREGLLMGARFLDAQHKVTHTAGDPWMQISHTVAGQTLHYQRLIGSFGQANPAINARLLEVVAAQIQAWACVQVADLYCGSGNLTLAAALAPSVQKVWAVEVAADGVEGVRRSAVASGLGKKVEVVQRDLSKTLDARTQQKLSDAVILDPPREGAKELIATLKKLRPKHILYVSCSPPHLARDLALLGDAYTLDALHAFDMFPRTPHLEVMACLSRRS